MKVITLTILESRFADMSIPETSSLISEMISHGVYLDPSMTESITVSVANGEAVVALSA